MSTGIPLTLTLIEGIELDEHGNPISDEGGNSVPATILAFMKAFLGTAILFIPNGYKSGGMIGASAVILLCGSVATFCMHRLLDTKNALSEREGRPICSFSEIAFLSAGKTGKILVDVATVSSQVGFCCVYFSFIAQNMGIIYDFGWDPETPAPGPPAVNGTSPDAPAPEATFNAQLAWMAISAAIFIPLVWIRKLAYFTTTNMIALVVIMASLVLVLGCGGYQLANHGIGPDINWVLGPSFLSFFGTSVYAFEGIVMVPFIEQEMREKEKFRAVLNGCMVAIVVIMAGSGSVSYLAFGDPVKDIILQNLDQITDKAWWHIAIKAELGLYCVAVLCTFPLMMYPPIKITERKLFRDEDGVPMESRSGRKWSKNVWRTVLVGICLGIAASTTKALDHFVSVIGATACVALAFTFPAYFHLKAVAEVTGEGVYMDYGLIAFGVVGSIVALGAAILAWINSS